LLASVGAWAIAALLLLSVPGAAAPPFRITHNVRSSDATAVVLDGRVFNETEREVLDVWLTAEGLSPAGKVLTRGITFVSPMIPGRGSAAFVAKIPAVDGVASFRLAVSSYRSGMMGLQSP
jgi:hypothetical protein